MSTATARPGCTGVNESSSAKRPPRVETRTRRSTATPRQRIVVLLPENRRRPTNRRVRSDRTDHQGAAGMGGPNSGHRPGRQPISHPGTWRERTAQRVASRRFASRRWRRKARPLPRLTSSQEPSQTAHNGTYGWLSKEGEESVHTLLLKEMEPAFTLETILESDDGDHVEHIRVALVGPADPLNG